MSDSPSLPDFPTDELTLGMVEHALGYCLTYEGESGEHLDEPRGIGAEFSLHSLLDFLSGTTTDPLGAGGSETCGGRMNWRDRLDARIDRCPGCDQWRWDRRCAVCDAVVLELPERGAA